jgi:hypothetical protein
MMPCKSPIPSPLLSKKEPTKIWYHVPAFGLFASGEIEKPDEEGMSQKKRKREKRKIKKE